MTANAISDGQLPDGFDDLEPFVGEWVLPSSPARAQKRHATSIDEINKFYDALRPRLKEVLTYLDTVPYSEDMSAQDRRLLELTLSLAEITPAVEWYQQPDVIDGFDHGRLELTADFS